MGLDKLSIIVPVHNVEKYLDSCVESIVNQSYEELEILLVDDGSTDSSGSMCDEWAAKDKRIRVIHQANAGLSAARNTGVEAAKGAYIGFVDSDDYVHPNMYKRLYQAIKESNADISICREQAFYEDEQPEYVRDGKWGILRKESREEFLTHFLDDFTGPVTWAWNKLYKRSVLGAGCFRKGRTMEDVFFMSELAARIDSVVWVEERMYYYRQRRGSIMNSGNETVYLDYADALVFQYEQLKDLGNTVYAQKILCKSLNTLAGLWVKAAKDEQKKAADKLRKCFVFIYDRDIGIVRDKQEKGKLWLIRYMPFIYKILKRG